MSTTRVWNITNDPSTDVTPQNLMVLGKLLKPGQSVQVLEVELENAHKLMKSAAGKLLAIGKEPPAYLSKSKASLPEGMARGRGTAAASPVVKPEEPKQDSRGPKRKG